jgi:hypothetical protein
VYPYRNRVRWLMFGRYAHLVHAVNRRRRVVQDTILEQRVQSLQRWNFARFLASVPLTVGLVATIMSALATYLPGGLAIELVEDLLALSTAITGIATLGFLFLARTCSQLEIDILAILTVETE